jgi:DNA-binding response OmpR family regulator
MTIWRYRQHYFEKTNNNFLLMEKRPTLLIVDDSRLMCEFIALFLSSKYDVITQTDARRALELIHSGLRPDIILSDLYMPNMTGIEFIEAARLALPYVPIMIASGAQESQKRIECLAAGADDFLLKPFHPAEMEVRLSKLMRKMSVEHSLTMHKKPSLIQSALLNVSRIAAAF